MRLFLMRHGVAEESAPGGDAARELTEEGRIRARKVLREAKESIGDLDLIVSSPYVRAKQTADLVHAEFPKAKRTETELVIPHGNPSDFLDWSSKNFRGVKSALVASHEPYLGSLAGVLLCGRDNPLLVFDKAGIACFDWEGAGTPTILRWFMSPKQIGR